AEGGRGIDFHMRLSGAWCVLARGWLLVKVETDTWVITTLARRCGNYFSAEGIKVSGCDPAGLKPMVKFARRMGIEWHVLL
ncbi:TOPRIM nucleotidyl transferase/hydrolase domain-containing protein, partial [Salmonella enterica]|uniref:TOPRIM nucleotidyl transferase/hydrolase domain-containing protein n=1 Tax=Salmonella enterica TaxID=28901 RepID=UPI00398C5AF8